MANQGSSGNSGWRSSISRNPDEIRMNQHGRLTEIGGMSHTRTASGLDHHQMIMQQAAEDQAMRLGVDWSKREAQKKEEQEEEDIYYLLT